MAENHVRVHAHRIETSPGRGIQIAIVGTGVAILLVIVFFGGVAQVGLEQCPVCLNNVCGPSFKVCPPSVLGLWQVITILFLTSAFIGLGLSRTAVLGMVGTGDELIEARSMPRKYPGLDVIAPTLSFFGWSVLALGLLLDFFGYCVYSPCHFLYDLSGYPLLLALAGGVMLAAGFGLILGLSRNALVSS